MEKKKLTLMMDFLNGPLWKNKYNEELDLDYTGIPVVDNDEVLQKLNQQIQDMYSELYDFDYKDKGCYFHTEKLAELKPTFRKLLEELKTRIAEINDGSFYVEDTIKDFD